MLADSPGIRHVTAIVGDARRNVDFYAGVLGLRLVKRSVNYENVLRYHLYYGNETGDPGTTLTCFPYPSDVAGRFGRPRKGAVGFVVPPDSLGDWADRLESRGVGVAGPEDRFGDPVLRFADPDGTRVELLAGDQPVEPWTRGPVPEENAIRGLHGVTALTVNPYATAR